MATVNLDLSPGELQGQSGGPFDVPFPVWAGLDACLVALAEAPANTAPGLSALASYADLVAAAARWRPQTLPALVSVANDIDQFGRDVVDVQLPTLANALTSQASQPTASGLQQARTVLLQIATTVQEHETSAAAVAAQLLEVDDDLQLVRTQVEDALSDSMGGPGGPPNSIVGLDALAQSLSELAAALASVGTPPQQDLERIRGAWAALGDDLGSFQSTIQETADSGSPYIVNLDLDVATSEWTAIATQARDFAQRASAL